MSEPVTLTPEEVQELHRYLFSAFLDPNAYPALARLVVRVAKAQEAA